MPDIAGSRAILFAWYRPESTAGCAGAGGANDRRFAGSALQPRSRHWPSGQFQTPHLFGVYWSRGTHALAATAGLATLAPQELARTLIDY